MADSDMTDIPPPKRVVFYKSGSQSYPGFKVAVNKRDTIQSLSRTLSQKTDIGVRSIYTPGATTKVTSVDELNDGEFYIVSAVNKAVPVDVDRIPNRKTWNNIRGGENSSSQRQNRRQRHHGSKGSSLTPHPPSSDRNSDNERGNANGSSDSRRIHSHPKSMPSKPKRIVVFKNGDMNLKHMVLLNPRSKYEFDNLLIDISDMFQLRVCKLFTTEGFKVNCIKGKLNIVSLIK